MSFFEIILENIVFILSYQAAPPLENDVKQILDECKISEKASDDDVQKLVDHRAPQGLNAKCLLACLYEKTGVVSSTASHMLLMEKKK